MLTVPEACDTVGALRAILKERIRDVRFCMWWESDSDKPSSYKRNGLDDEVKIPETQEVPLVIAIPPFALYFKINNQEISLDELSNPVQNLKSLREKLKDAFKFETECANLRPPGEWTLNGNGVTWNTYCYQLWNMEGRPGSSSEARIEIQLPPSRLFFEIDGDLLVVEHEDLMSRALNELFTLIADRYKECNHGRQLLRMEDMQLQTQETEEMVPWKTKVSQIRQEEGEPGFKEDNPLVIRGLFTWVVTNNELDPLQKYLDRGKIIRDGELSLAKNEKNCINQIDLYCDKFGTGTTNGAGLSPFVVLENSTGTGKTQIAFCQARPILYVVCARSSYELQPIYMPFARIFVYMQKLWELDLVVLQNNGVEIAPPSADELQPLQLIKLRMYGYLLGYLKFISENCSEDSRAVSGVNNGGEVSFTFSACTWEELLNECEAFKKPKPLIILDEVASNKVFAVYIRNICRLAHIPIVLMGTDSAVVNFLQARNDTSRDGEYHYGLLITRLPKLYLLPEEEEGLKCIPEDMRALVVSSRPLCALKMIEAASQYKENVCLDALVRAVYEGVVRPKLRKDVAKFQEAHMMYLASSSRLFENSLPKDHDTKIHKSCTTVFLSNHFGQLREGPILLFYRGACPDNEPDARIIGEWRPSVEFRNLEEDFFLHMALLKNTGKMLDKKSLHSVDLKRWTEIDSNCAGMGQSNPVMSWRLEARVLAAACISSMRNGIEGVTLVDFLEEFLFQLNPNSTGECVKVDASKLCLHEDIRGWKEKFPLLGLPMDEIDFWKGARHLLPSKPLGNVSIPSDQQRHDGRVIVDRKVMLSFESKDRADNTIPFDIKTIESVLGANAETDAKLVLVVLNGDKANYENKSIDLIEEWCETNEFLAVYARRSSQDKNCIEFDEFKKIQCRKKQKIARVPDAESRSLIDETQTAAQCTGAPRTLGFVFPNDVFKSGAYSRA